MNDKTHRIVDAARKRFRYYGIGKTTMQEIAQDAGVAVGTLYLYFGNKDDLIVACAAEFVEHHRQQIESILGSQASPAEKLRKYIVARFRQSEDTRTSSRHAAEITRAVLRVKPDRIEEEAQIMCDTITEILRLGVRQGAFRIARPQSDAKVFLYSIACFFPNALSEPPASPTERELLLVVNWFIEKWSGGRMKSKAVAGKAIRRATGAKRR